MVYEIYGKAHKTVKKIVNQKSKQLAYRMVDVSDEDFINGRLNGKGNFFNELISVEEITKNQTYPMENIVPLNSFTNLKESYRRIRKCSSSQLGVRLEDAEEKWLDFIESSIIPNGYRNAGLHYGGYILDNESWCLPSWIWTNAAIVRMYCTLGEYYKAKQLCNLLISVQDECGGWIVRNDYDNNGSIPVLAPNDSAYVANNGCLNVYLVSGDVKYLDAAIKCASWIMETARDDGMIYVGYNSRDNYWQTKNNIVDVGFTAGLFAKLYRITKEVRYKAFLIKFIKKYIELFYIPSSKAFTTSLNEKDRQIGGMFGRGQAWALEGLIPTYEVLKNKKLKKIIDDTVLTLLKLQNKNGGWAYNLSRPLMGIDCKATPIIASSLLNWSTDERIIKAVKKALAWTISHTSPSGTSAGGIYSYSIEGAIVHHLYTWTALVYSSAYAIELKRKVDSFDIFK